MFCCFNRFNFEECKKKFQEVMQKYKVGHTHTTHKHQKLSYYLFEILQTYYILKHY